jgi:hypothetical protein
VARVSSSIEPWSMVDGTPSVKQVPQAGGKLGFGGDVAATPELTENSPQLRLPHPIRSATTSRVGSCPGRRRPALLGGETRPTDRGFDAVVRP